MESALEVEDISIPAAVLGLQQLSQGGLNDELLYKTSRALSLASEMPNEYGKFFQPDPIYRLPCLGKCLTVYILQAMRRHNRRCILRI